MLRIFFTFGVLLWVSCSVDLPAPLAPSGKRTSESLVAVAGDSLYCRDAAFWRAYCDRWGEDLAHGGCEAIATCAEGDTAGVAAIVSDTAWVPFNPSAHGWLRVPQRSPSARFQRWTHPHYANWGEPSQYDAPAPPRYIGLVTYPFRTQRGKRILYGFPSEPYLASFIETISEQPEQPEPPQPQEPEEEPPGEVPVRVHNLYVGGLWSVQYEDPEGLSVRSLPSWLSFDEATGTIEGTPTQAGTYEYIVNHGDGFTERHLLIVADEVPDRFPETFILGQGYGFTPYIPESGVSFTIEGDLPPGFSFDPERVHIHGTPEATGTFDFDYVVTDASGEEVLRREFRYVVITDPSSTQPSEEPESPQPQEPREVRVHNAYVGFPWRLRFEDPEGISVRSLPSWLSFDEATGRIEGTPTQAGTYEFVVDYGDGSAERVLLIVADEAPDRYVQTFILGRNYDSGLYIPETGVRPLAFFIEGNLPPGFSFDPERVRIDGTPEATGTFDFDYVVIDASGEEVLREEYRYVVITDPSLTQPAEESPAEEPPAEEPPAEEPPAEESPAEEPHLILDASVGVPYEYLLWQPAEPSIVHSIVGALPDGLSFDEERIAITGTPTQVGSTDFVHLLTYENGGEYLRGRLRIVVH